MGYHRRRRPVDCPDASVLGCSWVPVVARQPRLHSHYYLFMLSSCTSCVLSVPYPCQFCPSISLFPSTRLATNCNLEFFICCRTSHHMCPSFFGSYSYRFSLIQGAVWYHLSGVKIIDTVRKIGQAHHIIRHSFGSCGSPSDPMATPGGSSPMISVGGAPFSCICSTRTSHCRSLRKKGRY